MRVAVVEDSPELRHLACLEVELAAGLELAGSAADAEGAWQLLLTTAADAAVIDLHLPRSSGVDLIRDLRARGLDLRIVAFSADDAALADARAAGADVALRKTGDYDALLAAVRGT